jgi:hypothetical protein
MAREGSGHRRMAFIIKEAKALRGAYSHAVSTYDQLIYRLATLLHC